MKKEFARKLIDTLRSGEYKQTRHIFRREMEDGQMCYCVAGVIADMCGVNWVRRYEGGDGFRIDGSWSMAQLPQNVLSQISDVDRIGDTDDEIGQMSLDNDTLGTTFEQFADKLEAKYFP